MQIQHHYVHVHWARRSSWACGNCPSKVFDAWNHVDPGARLSEGHNLVYCLWPTVSSGLILREALFVLLADLCEIYIYIYICVCFSFLKPTRPPLKPRNSIGFHPFASWRSARTADSLGNESVGCFGLLAVCSPGSIPGWWPVFPADMLDPGGGLPCLDAVVVPTAPCCTATTNFGRTTLLDITGIPVFISIRRSFCLIENRLQPAGLS